MKLLAAIVSFVFIVGLLVAIVRGIKTRFTLILLLDCTLFAIFGALAAKWFFSL